MTSSAFELKSSAYNLLTYNAHHVQYISTSPRHMVVWTTHTSKSSHGTHTHHL